MSKYGNSSFWLGNWADDDVVTSTMSSTERKSHDLYKMASTKRAISNFVSIVTNQSIPVIFRENGESYTTGDKVVIGANVVKPTDFDVCVGLALHEGSHIIMSDFDMLRKLDTIINESTYLRGEQKGMTRGEIRSYLKDLWNYVEDRRIDNYIYSTAPGYRSYYKAMYDKYFNDHIISKALRSNEMTDESLESYRFRIINLHSDDARIDALNGLREIYNTVDLPRIGRLKNSKEALDVATEIFDIILKNLPEPQEGMGDGDGDSQNGDSENSQNSGSESESSQNTQSGESSQGNSSDEGNDSEGSDDSADTQGGQGSDDGSESDSEGSEGSEGGSSKQMTGEESDEKSSQGSPSNDSEMDGEGETGDSSNESGSSSSSSSNGGETPDGSPSSGSDEDRPELTERQKKLLPKRMEKQRKFLDGETQKTGISSSEQKELEQIEESGSEIRNVGDDVETDRNSWYSDSHYNKGGVDCIVVKKMSESLMKSPLFPMASTSWNNSDELRKPYEEAVQEGIRIGNTLGKKLQVRSEERETIFNRQKSGKIDKRMIASLGYGNESVFYTEELDSFKKANLHVSIDASGSMNGSKWTETITNVVALCKAVDMIPNLDIQVTFRTTSADTASKGDNSKPYIVKAYDSKEDTFMKVRQLFPALHTSGTTPEGLCFEAIMDEFMPVSNEWDSYFLNISDGMPYFGNSDYHYSGDSAYEHTRKMVKGIEKMGIKVLSYYVENYGSNDGQPSPAFTKMYGRSAKKIDVTNVSQISRTMNRLFLEK